MLLTVFVWTTGKYEELSSSDESCSAPQRQRPVRRTKGPSIHDGPQALAKITAVGIGGKKQSRYGENSLKPNWESFMVSGALQLFLCQQLSFHLGFSMHGLYKKENSELPHTRLYSFWFKTKVCWMHLWELDIEWKIICRTSTALNSITVPSHSWKQPSFSFEVGSKAWEPFSADDKGRGHTIQKITDNERKFATPGPVSFVFLDAWSTTSKKKKSSFQGLCRRPRERSL